MIDYCGGDLKTARFVWRSPRARLLHKALRRLGLIAVPVFRPCGHAVWLSEMTREAFDKSFALLRDSERTFLRPAKEGDRFPPYATSNVTYGPPWSTTNQWASYRVLAAAEQERTGEPLPHGPYIP